MDESTLLAEIQADLSASTGEGQQEIADEREKALKYYQGEKYGNEIKGRSKIVTTEVADTIEGMLPQILKPFISNENVVYFDPVGPEDEMQAKQETTTLNHVFYKQNDGVSLLYTFCKDGLLSKNGIVKYFWDESLDIRTEPYTGLDEMSLSKLLSDDDVEVTEETAYDDITYDELGNAVEVVTRHDVTIKRTTRKKKATAVAVPPEEFKIRPEYAHLDLADVPFCAHERDVPASDLVAMGYPKDLIESLAGGGEGSQDNEKTARFENVAELGGGSTSSDWTMNLVKYSECYKRVDYDGDGFAELRKVCVANGTEILANDEIDYVPFVSWTPVPMTHRFFGRSAADQTMDLQLQKSMLVRNIFDNLYQANNVRHAVVEGEVSLDDLLDNTPGSYVRMSAPGMVQPLAVPMLTGHPYQMLEYIDTIKENRTGQTRYNQGIDADSLNKTASGINRIMDASAQRLQLVATLFGEAVKRLMLGLHRLLLQNQDQEMLIQLRGNWVSVNPTEWRERTNMTVVVGLGTGDKDREIQYLSMILAQQKEVLQNGLPLTNLDQVYNTLGKIVEAANLKDVNVYWTDPQGAQMPQRESPEQKVVEAQLQAAGQQNQVKAQENQQDYEVNMRKLALEERRVSLEERKQALEEYKVGMEMEDDVLQRKVAADQAEMEALGALSG